MAGALGRVFAERPHPFEAAPLWGEGIAFAPWIGSPKRPQPCVAGDVAGDDMFPAPVPPRLGTLKLEREICCMPRCCCSNGTRDSGAAVLRPAKPETLLREKFAAEAERSVIRRLLRSGATGRTPRTAPACCI